MKKKKLKSKPIIILLLLLIIVLIVSFFVFKKSDKEKLETEILDKKQVVYTKLKEKGIDENFIKYVDDNYKDSILMFYDLLDSKEYDISDWHLITGYSYNVLNDLYNNKYESMSNVKIIDSNNDIATLSFIGDVSLADNWYIMPAYDERGEGVNGILSDAVLDIMRNSTIMVANSEFTVSNRGTKMAGKQYTFRAKPERLAIYDEMGVDLVTLANNHVYDFGKDAFLDMLDELNNYNIPYIGAGRNFEEASKPYYYIINGYKIALLNGTRAEKYILTPEATDENPGVFRCYDTTNMVNKIKEVRENSDIVITIMHFGKESSHELEKEQISSAKEYIDAGSDIIIGHHAHVLQGIEFYNGKPIIYNLGNFIFNAETVDTAIFQILLDKSGNMEYKMIPAIQKNKYTDLLYDADKQRLINDFNSWSINAHMDEDGIISQE